MAKALSVGEPLERHNRISRKIRAVADTTTPRTKNFLVFIELVARTEEEPFEFLARNLKSIWKLIICNP